MVISSTRFQHLTIPKATWRSPDLNTKNQIDHVVIDGRHASNILVRSLRTANMDLDHFLVAAIVRTRLCAYNKHVHKRLPNHSPFACRNSLPMLLQIPTSIRSGNTLLHTAAGEKVGYRRQQKSTWFDDECRQVAIEKNDATKSAATRAVYEK